MWFLEIDYQASCLYYAVWRWTTQWGDIDSTSVVLGWLGKKCAKSEVVIIAVGPYELFEQCTSRSLRAIVEQLVA